MITETPAQAHANTHDTLTLVDGTKVPRARLRDGSTIKIGHTEMTVRIDGGRDEAGGWNV